MLLLSQGVLAVAMCSSLLAVAVAVYRLLLIVLLSCLVSDFRFVFVVIELSFSVCIVMLFVCIVVSVVLQCCLEFAFVYCLLCVVGCLLSSVVVYRRPKMTQ